MSGRRCADPAERDARALANAPTDVRGADRAERVRAVVRAGARVADPTDPLGKDARARLPEATGLSPESVELALAEHMETRPSSDDLRALLAGAGAAERCHVILSANVCTAALRALAIACATAPHVLAKPSRRDPVVAELLARALAEDPAFAAAGGTITLVAHAAPTAGDELHVYGSDETIASVRATLPQGVTLRAHGAGFGVAILEEDTDVEAAAGALARDVVAFDQRGCLSPRVALVIGDGALAELVVRAELVMRALAAELSVWNRRAPRGRLHADEAAELRRYVETAAALGAAIEGEGFAVGLDEAPSALLLPPPARAIHVVPAALADVGRLLAPWGPKIAAIGHSSGRRDGAETRGGAVPEEGRAPAAPPALVAAIKIAPGARVSMLGAMQRPPLDGPVDLRAATKPR